jgi:hypothetical protein
MIVGFNPIIFPMTKLRQVIIHRIITCMWVRQVIVGSDQVYLLQSICNQTDFVADHYEADKKTDIMFAKCLPNEKTTQLLAKLEGNLKLSQQIYDTGIIPNRILDDIRQEINV